ncbi:molybdopterin molybdotransferase MoeA [Nesterenkonia populi]
MTGNSTGPSSAEQGAEPLIAPGEHGNAAGHHNNAPHRASVEEHIRRLAEVLSTALRARRTETLPIGANRLARRVSAQRITAPMGLPGFDNSQMDGFALRSADLTLPEAELPAAGIAPAGSAPQQLPERTAIAVMTGAPIPDGADLVIPVEKTQGGFKDAQRGGTVRFHGLAAEDLVAGTFIRRAGSDIAAGDVLAEAGQLLTPAVLGALAGCGVAQVPVLEQIRTLLVSTGEEIRAPGETLSPGELYDANGALLTGVLEELGHQVRSAQLATDQPESFGEQLDALLAEHRPHLLVTVGGVSAGAYEVVRQTFGQRGVSFGSVAQQPGGPQGWGTLHAGQHQTGVICLPGNPVSAAVSLETLVRPALTDAAPETPPQRRIEVRLAEPLTSKLGVAQYRRVTLRPGNGGEPSATPVGGPSSHLLGHLARADALLELTPQDTDVPAGAPRTALLLPGRSAP